MLVAAEQRVEDEFVDALATARRPRPADRDWSGLLSMIMTSVLGSGLREQAENRMSTETRASGEDRERQLTSRAKLTTEANSSDATI